ncbi:TPA: 3-deoxy-manno-octulosonate cytidylyltransferase [Yersinia enterocolitica]|nr:3-deoxy-manno-octulosonate cytidylyltransferase [Yersinia enterocolitica]
MKIVGIIPARYKSSRYEGKPLADINGKPMIWWVYNQVKKVNELEEVYVATDDARIEKVCIELSMNVIMTSEDNKTPNDRIYEASTKINADLYVAVLGDEPLIEPEIISSVIPKVNTNDISDLYVANLMTEIRDPTEVIDFTNLKIVTNQYGRGLYISRSPIPYPKGTLEFKYKKFVGVSIFTKNALKFYHETERGVLEAAEDNDFIRFIENGIDVWFIEVKTNSLSVDTPKDLERVKKKVGIINENH